MTTTVTGSTTNNSLMLDMPDVQLLGLYADALTALEECKVWAGHIEMELLHRMEERGATSIPDDTFICEAPLRYEYPLGCFTPLKEIFNATELDECYWPAKQVLIPEHWEYHPELWNTPKTLSLAKKRGTEAMAVVERNRLPAARRIRFTKRAAT